MVKLLGESITGLLREIWGQKSDVLAEIMINWPKIVGVEFASIIEPVRIYSAREKASQVNVLLVRAFSSAAGLKLAYQQEIIVERIAIYFGHKAIHRIKIKTDV